MAHLADARKVLPSAGPAVNSAIDPLLPRPHRRRASRDDDARHLDGSNQPSQAPRNLWKRERDVCSFRMMTANRRSGGQAGRTSVPRSPKPRRRRRKFARRQEVHERRGAFRRTRLAPSHSGRISGRARATAMSASSSEFTIVIWRSLRIAAPRRNHGSRAPAKRVAPRWRSPATPSKSTVSEATGRVSKPSPSASRVDATVAPIVCAGITSGAPINPGISGAGCAGRLIARVRSKPRQASPDRRAKRLS